MDDRELLRDFTERRSQDAFRQLVERHLPMVFSTARRMVCDSHLAEEVAQNVFTTLAQKAASIRPPQVVGGWLYNTTRHLALHAVRSEQRRREREQTAFAMQTLDLASDEPRITEHLEPAMAELESDDRDALVLRYLENRSLREVGRELGLSEDAARMRVNRALERLRSAFERQGTPVNTVLLATCIAATTASVPAGLATAIATTSLTTVTTVTLSQATIITMNWLNAKTIAAAIAAAVVAGSGTYLVQNERLKTFESQRRDSLARLNQTAADRDDALAAMKLQAVETEKLRKDVNELPRLRNEVTQLRRDNRAALEQAAQKTTPPPIARATTNPSKYDRYEVAPSEVPEAVIAAARQLAQGSTFQKFLQSRTFLPDGTWATNSSVWVLEFDRDGADRSVLISTRIVVRDGRPETEVTQVDPVRPPSKSTSQ